MTRPEGRRNGRGLAASMDRAAQGLESLATERSGSGRIAALAGRVLRAPARFRDIARSDGIGAALARAHGKVRGKLRGPIRALIHRFGPNHCPYFTPPPRMEDYAAWQRVNQDNPRRRRWLDVASRPPGSSPRFSILVPVYNPPIDVFRAMIHSVLGQTSGDWELILVDDASPDPRICRELGYWASKDRRIRAVYRRENGNISIATNDAAEVARGEFLVLLDHDDLLHPDALSHLSAHLDNHPETDLLYSDDDKIDQDGRRHSPQLKPDWSPELLLAFCYTTHLTAVKRTLYQRVGGMRPGFEGSQDHDFWLRASERALAIDHIPQVLYHWRALPGSTALAGAYKPASFEAGRLAVEEAFHRRGLDIPVIQSEWASRYGCAIFEPVMPDDGPSVAILIPSRNHAARLRVVLDSLTKTTYQNYRIYILDNESDDPETLEYLASLPHTVLKIPNKDGAFSFAAINNTAAGMVSEDLLLFLNDDTEVINPRWLSQMVGWSRLEGVGAVGARLLFPDGRIQHAGILQGVPEGLAGHAFKYQPWWYPGYLNLARVSRDCAAVTAACMLTPRSLFLQLGGFDETHFAVAYNDPDYGHRLADLGYRSVYCAEAELYHHEGASRGTSSNPDEMASYRSLYGHRVDPYYSPHLDPESEGFAIRPTVVPVGPASEPIAILAALADLDGVGDGLIAFERLQRLHRQGAVRAEVISPVDGPFREAYEQAGIPVRIESELADLAGERCRLDHYRAATARLSGWIAERGFDVIHANDAATFWAIETARIAGIPSVWSLHEHERWQRRFNNLPASVAASALSCVSMPYRVIFPSIGATQLWNDLDTALNFALIRPGVDVDALRRDLDQIDRSQAREALGLSPDDLCVLATAPRGGTAGTLDLVRAFAVLPASLATRLQCILIADEDDRLAAEVSKLPPERRDRFAIDDETVDRAACWKAADLFCDTSPTILDASSILKAMTAGLPIIANATAGIAELVRPDVNALLVPPGDVATLVGHLSALATDESIRRSMAEQSPRIVRSLPDAARMDRLYLQTFRAAAESSPLGLSEPIRTSGRHPHFWMNASGRRHPVAHASVSR